MYKFNDGWISTPHKSKRKRGKKCATKRIKYLFVGNELIPIWRTSKLFNRYSCWGHVEKGKKYCVKCLAVHKKLKELGRAPKRK